MHLANVLGAVLAGMTAAVLALTQSEAWLLRAAVVLFVLMLVFCAVIWLQVNESTRIANAANDLATDLDKRTAALEEKYGPKV